MQDTNAVVCVGLLEGVKQARPDEGPPPVGGSMPVKLMLPALPAR